MWVFFRIRINGVSVFQLVLNYIHVEFYLKTNFACFIFSSFCVSMGEAYYNEPLSYFRTLYCKNDRYIEDNHMVDEHIGVFYYGAHFCIFIAIFRESTQYNVLATAQKYIYNCNLNIKNSKRKCIEFRPTTLSQRIDLAGCYLSQWKHITARIGYVYICSSFIEDLKIEETFLQYKIK